MKKPSETESVLQINSPESIPLPKQRQAAAATKAQITIDEVGVRAFDRTV